MELITSLGKIEGKTIQSASLVDMAESLALVFTDNTYAVFEVRMYGESYDMEMSDDVGSYTQKQIGIISEEEYEDIQRRQHEFMSDQKRQNELRRLAELKAKYPDA